MFTLNSTAKIKYEIRDDIENVLLIMVGMNLLVSVIDSMNVWINNWIIDLQFILDVRAKD